MREFLASYLTYPYIFPNFPSVHPSVIVCITASPATAIGPTDMIFGMMIGPMAVAGEAVMHTMTEGWTDGKLGNI